MKLSEHFTLEELIHTDHREFDNTPNEYEVENLTRLAQMLEDVREVLGKPIIVNSAFRSKAVNDAVGSKDTSQHRLGCAADIRVPGMTPHQVCERIINSALQYDQIIREFATPTGGGWTHISVPNTPDAHPRMSKLIIDKLGTRKYEA